MSNIAIPMSPLILAALLAVSPLSAPAQAPTLLVENARVIVGDGTVLEQGSIVVFGDRIISVTTDRIRAPGAYRIDAAGKTVLPGLIDTHVHLLMEQLFAQPRSDSAFASFAAERLPNRLRAYIDAGITTVMAPGDYWPYAADIRDRVRLGDLEGPRIYTAGPLLTAPAGHPAATFCGSLDVGGPNPWCREHLTEEVDTLEEARGVVARLSQGGADLIKIVHDAASGPDEGVLEAEFVGEIVRAAHKHGLRVYTHSLQLSKAIAAIQHGVDGLVHLPAGSTRSEEVEHLAQLMRAEGLAASTTLTGFDSMAEIAASQGNDHMVRVMEGLLEGMNQTLVRLAKDDGLIVIGTDAPHLPPGEAYQREVELVTQMGLAPERVIRAATRDAAIYMGLGGELGTLEAGKLADFIVVDGDPLTDLSTLQNVVAVVKGGQPIRRRE